MAWECGAFDAWHDWMPGKDPTMRVVGGVTFPTTGYSASLRLSEPQGINPDDLLLELDVEEPGGPVNEVKTALPVEFSMATGFPYTTVSIKDCIAGIPVKELEKPGP